MREHQIPIYLINLTRITMENVECRLRIDGNLRKPFKTSNRLRQGSVEKTIRVSGITTTGAMYNKSIQILAYADDIDIIGSSEAVVKEAYRALKGAA